MRGIKTSNGRLNGRTVSTKKVTFPCAIQKVWDTVTSLDKYAWRSDISRIEVLSENRFAEYTREGYEIVFTVTATEPGKRWKFDRENIRIKGHRTGLFSQKEGQTTMDFTEEVVAKKFYLEPFVKACLKKQQTAYIADLKKALA